MELISVHYHELALKGGNRGRFERKLRENIGLALSPCSVRSAAGRILVETEDAEAALQKAVHVCGVAHAFAVSRMSPDIREVGEAVAAALGRQRPAHFRISTKRADKSFPMTSVEIDREIGAIVHEATGIPVRLKGAESNVHVMWLPGEVLVGYEKHGGPGGLPVGTGGRIAVLMSGGIDSPVAAWRMIRRGCRADLIHFHSHPLVDRTTQEKARDIAEILNRWQYRTRLYLVPLAQIQTEVRLKCPEPLRVILYRRFMVRIAERIARRRRDRALVTGESLGQVASQTLRNLATVDAVARLPILRPLVGSDKREIVAEAERLGTYAVSIQPDQDCCQLFVPKHPATGSSPWEAERAEEALDVDGLIADAQQRAEIVEWETRRSP